jgi:hypothetical protein
MPGAVFVIGTERHAIDVELSAGNDEDVVARIDHRLARYDAMIFFCTRPALAALRQLQAEHRWPGLVVRALPRPSSMSIRSQEASHGTPG